MVVAELPNRFVFIEANLTRVLESLEEWFGFPDQAMQIIVDYTPSGWHPFETIIELSKRWEPLKILLQERKSFAQRRELVAKRKQWQTKT